MKVPTSPRSRSVDSEWRTHAEAWNRSGLTATVFAQQHDLLPHNLYAWRRRLRFETTPPTAAPTPSTVRLVPVTLEAPTLCELAFADGRCLRFSPHIDPITLAAVLRVVSAR